MTTYAVNEASIRDGALREIYSFVIASGNYQLTSHDEDVTYNAVTYSKVAGFSRGPIQFAPLTQLREIVITLPRDHAIVAALMPSPPRVSTVSIVRIYADSTASANDRRQVWFGALAGVSLDGKYAHIRVPSEMDVAFDVDVPIPVLSRTCQYQLYSVGCTMAASGANKKTPTVGAVNGGLITCSSLAGWTYQAKLGYVKRVSDGEQRSILDQSGNDITVDVPFATLTIGDALEVYRGCDKQRATCRNDFANIRNFGGHPDLPSFNPGSPTGKGIV